MEDLKQAHQYSSARKQDDIMSQRQSEIQQSAYSGSRATSGRAARRREEALSMQEYNRTLRDA